MVEVDRLTKYYGGFAAIQDVSFVADRGQILGFLGPNGAGKTTTMRILTGYMPASSGTARVAGHDVFEESLEVRRRIGYLPETPPVYRDMTPRSYLDFVARIKGVAKRDRAAAVGRALASTQTENVANQPIGTLSRGYKQRVAVAQALVHDPEVLILDEPTIGLDPRQIIEIRNLIRSLAADRTVILSTHILPEVKQLCDKVVIIANGRIVADELLGNISADDLEAYFLDVTTRDVAAVAAEAPAASGNGEPPASAHDAAPDEGGSDLTGGEGEDDTLDDAEDSGQGDDREAAS
jgi:ABC-2 type transport system ATP-binding protein